MNYLILNKKNERKYKDIASDLSIDYKTLANWRDGRTIPHKKDFPDIAAYFGYTSEIFDNVDMIVGDDKEIHFDKLSQISEVALANRKDFNLAKQQILNGCLSFAAAQGFEFSDDFKNVFSSMAGFDFLNDASADLLVIGSEDLNNIKDFSSYLFEFLHTEFVTRFSEYLNLTQPIKERMIAQIQKDIKNIDDRIAKLNLEKKDFLDKLPDLKNDLTNSQNSLKRFAATPGIYTQESESSIIIPAEYDDIIEQYTAIIFIQTETINRTQGAIKRIEKLIDVLEDYKNTAILDDLKKVTILEEITKLNNQ